MAITRNSKDLGRTVLWLLLSGSLAMLPVILDYGFALILNISPPNDQEYFEEGVFLFVTLTLLGTSLSDYMLFDGPSTRSTVMNLIELVLFGAVLLFSGCLWILCNLEKFGNPLQVDAAKILLMQTRLQMASLAISVFLSGSVKLRSFSEKQYPVNRQQPVDG